jgi:hypothetical protein
MFQVLNNDIPAQYPYMPIHPSWNQSTFQSFDEAQEYACQYLGPFSPGKIFKLNEPYDYSGYGDCISIIEVGE